MTGLLLLCFVVSVAAVYEGNLEKIVTLPRPHKGKTYQSLRGRNQDSDVPQPLNYDAQRENAEPLVEETSAGDTAQSGLDSAAKKMSQLYTTIRNVALPQSDSNSQRLVMLTPGKVLNYYDYYPGPEYEKSMEGLDPKRTQISIPVRVMENMFALADGIPGIDPLHGAETGESLAVIYKNLLDWMQIKGFNQKTQEEKKRFLLAVEYLTQTVPDPFNVSVNVTRFNLYRRGEDAYNSKRLEMEDIIAGKRSVLFQDEFERWFQRNYPSLNARVEAAYTEWLVFGEKEIVELYKAYLDVQAPGIDLEEARMALRASGVISLDRSRTIYPVSFVPSNWYRYLTDVSKVDKASRLRAMSGDQIRLQIGRLKSRKAVLEALKAVPMALDAKTAIDNAKNELEKAGKKITEDAKSAEKERQKCLAKRGCKMSGMKGTTDCGEFTKSSDSTTSDIDLNSEIYSCAESIIAQLSPESQGASIDKAIKDIEDAIKEYETVLGTSSIPLSQLADHAADDKEQLDANWLRFSFDSAASSQNSDSSSSYSSYSTSTSASGGNFFWSASASFSYSRSRSQQEFRSAMNNAKVAVQGELLRVTIQRPWFRPSVFRSALYQMADGVLVSPGDNLPEKEFFEKAKDRSKYLLPHYSTALLLSRNISIEFREITSNAVYQAVQQSSSFSAGFSVGGFWGSVGASASGSWGNSQSSAKVESTDTGLRITMPGVSIIGYYTQNVPLFPKS